MIQNSGDKVTWLGSFEDYVRVKSNRDQHPPGNPRAFDLTLPPYRREFDGLAGHLTT
jgi:hypothetical protein